MYMCKLKKTAVIKKIVFLLCYSHLQFLSVQKHCGFIGWIYTRYELSKAEIILAFKDTIYPFETYWLFHLSTRFDRQIRHIIHPNMGFIPRWFYLSWAPDELPIWDSLFFSLEASNQKYAGIYLNSCYNLLCLEFHLMVARTVSKFSLHVMYICKIH